MIRMKNGSAFRILQSAAHTVVACTRMRTSSSPGTGFGTSRISRTSGGPYRSKTAAFIGALVAFVRQSYRDTQAAGLSEVHLEEGRAWNRIESIGRDGLKTQ